MIRRNKTEIKQQQALKYLTILIGFTEALIIYMASSFFKEMSGYDSVGIFYVLIYLLFLVALFNLHKVIRRFGKSNVLKLVFIGQIAVTLFLLIVSNNWLRVVGLSLFLLCDQLLLVNLDIMIESFSSDESTGRIRGSFLTILNIGFITGPKISTWILSAFGYNVIFLIVLLLKLVALSLVQVRLSNVNHAFRAKASVKTLISKAWKHPDIRHIYYISFALECFYALMIMYSPIYLHSIGLSWAQIGSVFTIMLIPFLFFEYPIGWLADKELGEKEMIIFFLSGLTVALAWIYQFDQPSVWLWAFALFMTRVAAAGLEILRDSYFYKKIDGSDVDLIDCYRTARPVAYITAAALSAIAIHYSSLHEIFLLAGVMVLSGLYPAWRLKDNLSEREVLLLARNHEVRNNIRHTR